MSINPRFISYFRETFFDWKEEEFQRFLSSLENSLPRTIRITPGKESEVKKHLEKYGFLLTESYIPNVFSIDRREDFDPLERRIGYTLDHLVGNFYIQELAAATSVHILTDGEISREPYLILDMAASPGGKTTQLSEHYPNAFIIANEPTRERIPQLLQNLDRMGSTNIWVTLYPGQYFRHTEEMFDRVLLDAPCSGEWTLYKGTDATKHWHIKNIKNIASLQEKLLDAAVISLKTWGEMVYSTCSMNLLENEWVVDTIMKRYPWCLKIVYQKRFWPHIDGTGGFFVTKLEKTAPMMKKGGKQGRKDHINEEIKLLSDKQVKNVMRDGYIAYEHEGKILALSDHKDLEYIRKQYYFMRFGETIGKKDRDGIHYDLFAHRVLDLSSLPHYTLRDEEELDLYLRGHLLATDTNDGPVLLSYDGITIGVEEIQDGWLSNNFPRDWQRK